MRRALLLGSCLGLWTGIAAAQTSAGNSGPLTPAQPAPAPDAGSPQADSEIVVTARRQRETLQDVPASVSVFTEKTLLNAGVINTADVVQLTPGVTIVTGTAEVGDTQINIRGLNGARDAEPSVALVVDGIVKTNTAALNQEQGDVTQFEVLKGPQGALVWPQRGGGRGGDHHAQARRSSGRPRARQLRRGQTRSTPSPRSAARSPTASASSSRAITGEPTDSIRSPAPPTATGSMSTARTASTSRQGSPANSRTS